MASHAWLTIHWYIFQILYRFHRHALQIHYQLAMYNGLSLKEHVSRTRGS